MTAAHLLVVLVDQSSVGTLEDPGALDNLLTNYRMTREDLVEIHIVGVNGSNVVPATSPFDPNWLRDVKIGDPGPRSADDLAPVAKAIFDSHMHLNAAGVRHTTVIVSLLADPEGPLNSQLAHLGPIIRPQTLDVTSPALPEITAEPESGQQGHGKGSGVLPSLFYAICGAVIALIFSLIAWIPWVSLDIDGSVLRHHILAVVGIALTIVCLTLARFAMTRRAPQYRRTESLVTVLAAGAAAVLVARVLGIHNGWQVLTIAAAVVCIAFCVGSSALVRLAASVLAVPIALILWVPISWELAVIDAILVILLSGFIYTAGGWRFSMHALSAMAIVGVVLVVLAALSPRSSRAASLVAARPIEPKMSVLYDGTNFQDGAPVFLAGRQLAVSNNGVTAVRVEQGPTEAELWLVGNQGARRILSARDDVAPSGRALLPTDGDEHYHSTLSTILRDGDDFPRSELANTSTLSFDGETLYGISNHALWRLDGEKLHLVTRWSDDRYRSFDVIAPDRAAVVATTADYVSEVQIVDLKSGSIARTGTVNDTSGRDFQNISRRSGQAGYVGPAAVNNGRFLLLIGSQLHEMDANLVGTRVSEINFSDDTPVTRMAATQNRLALIQGTSAIVAKDYRARADWHSYFTKDAQRVPCGAPAPTSALPFDNVADIAVSKDGDTLEALADPNDSCSTLLWSTPTAGTPNWKPTGRAQDLTPPLVSTEHIYRGQLIFPNGDGSALSPFTSTVVGDTQSGFKLGYIPNRENIGDIISGYSKSPHQFWYAGQFLNNQRDSGQGTQPMLMSGDGNGEWRKRSDVYNSRDIAAISDTEVLVARCQEVSRFNSATNEWQRIAGRGDIRADCSSKADPGPHSQWFTSITMPYSISVASHGTTNIIYVADAKIALDGREYWMGVMVVDEATGQIAALPGGDITAVHAIPVDIAVSALHNVCLATSYIDGPGPLMVIIGGRARVVDTRDKRVTGCAWRGADLIATTDGGEVLMYSADPFNDESRVFIPNARR